MSSARYINPYTDFGFKKLFGEEGSKLLLIDFLNELLPSHHKISDLTFKNTDQLPDIKIERKAVFDIYCETKERSKFIVEMQKAKIDFFKDRAVFYTTFPIREQAEKGDWNFELKPVYCVAILDFEFDREKGTKIDYVSNVQLKNQYCDVFFDKLAFVFVEMPRFQKTEAELETHFDKWLYFLKNLETFDDIPEILKENVFIEGFRKAEIANYNAKERDQYEESLKVYRDLKAAMETAINEARQEARQKGRIEGRIEGEKIGIEKGREERDAGILRVTQRGKLTLDEIAEDFGMTLDYVKKLVNENKEKLNEF
jgi:predicted transposase/invertase (TIGR01784 family)